MPQQSQSATEILEDFPQSHWSLVYVERRKKLESDVVEDGGSCGGSGSNGVMDALA